MDIWDDYLVEEEESNKIKHLLDAQGLILFFKKDGDYYGAGEDSRVIFARLKNPDKDTGKGWTDEASFTATNLNKLLRGQPSTHVFDKDDIKKIKVMDRDKVIDAIKDEAPEDGPKMGSVRIIKIGHFNPKHDRDDAPNFVRADEE